MQERRDSLAYEKHVDGAEIELIVEGQSGLAVVGRVHASIELFRALA